MATTAIDTAWYSHTSSVQTMRTWSQVLTSFEEVPKVFQAELRQHATVFPYTVVIPEDRLSIFQKRNEKLLCLYEDHVALLEARRDKVTIAAYPFQDILYLEQGHVLLHSWIVIGSQAGASRVTFNTVTSHHFEPILNKIRNEGTKTALGNGQDSALQKSDLSGFDYLCPLNYKFMNYGRQSLRSGDRLLKTVYQPDRCVKTAKLFNRTVFRQYATGHLAVLTEQELILLREPERTRINDRHLYGGVFTYIPLRKIQDVSFTRDREQTLYVMKITLADKIHLRAEFAMDNPELDAFQEYLNGASIYAT